MATIAYVSQRYHGYVLVQWNELGADDTGALYEPPAGYVFRSIVVLGTLGSATVRMQGSNTDISSISTLATLSTGFNGLSLEARLLRPRVTGGSGSTDVDFQAYYTTRS